MLPVVAGAAATTRQIIGYSGLLVFASMLPWALGFAGPIYGAAAAVCGVILVALVLQLARSGGANRQAAHRLFAFSIVYLFALFATLLVSNCSRSNLFQPLGWTSESLQAGSPSSQLIIAPVTVKADEV
jgi:protoheme IX farnesyltransferase